MRKILIASFVLYLLAPCAFGYNVRDLKQLKETCSCPGGDFSNADLPNFILGDANTLNINNAKTDKYGAVVCDISRANFKGANLSNAYFSPADFGPGIQNKVGKIVMKGANFSGANLQGAHFNAVSADYSQFQNANLENSKMMKGSSFKLCDFTGANFKNASVKPPMDGYGADFTGSNFSSADLSGGNFIANFSNVNLNKAKLCHTTINSVMSNKNCN